jgi:hypothetical protein
LLLGLVREEEGLAARALCAMLESDHAEVLAERIRSEVVRIIGRGEEASRGAIPYTPRSKKILELSLREALSLGHNFIGTEHILLGLVRENEGVAARILRDLNLDSQQIRDEVIRMLTGRGGESPLDVKRREKEDAIERGEFEKAARLRDEERKLARDVRDPFNVLPSLVLAGKELAIAEALTGKRVEAITKAGAVVAGRLMSVSLEAITIIDEGIEATIEVRQLESLKPHK